MIEKQDVVSRYKALAIIAELAMAPQIIMGENGCEHTILACTSSYGRQPVIGVAAPERALMLGSSNW